jgi:hypothetical protein
MGIQRDRTPPRSGGRFGQESAVFDPFEFAMAGISHQPDPDRREDKLRCTLPVDAAGIDTDESALAE